MEFSLAPFGALRPRLAGFDVDRGSVAVVTT